jgi:hypothetical protein
LAYKTTQHSALRWLFFPNQKSQEHAMSHDNDTARQQTRNTDIDKTNPARDSGDVYANQGGGKLGGGNENSGHPANNVIAPQHRRDVNPDADATVPDGAAASATVPAQAGEKGTKSSGMPTLSGAGQLADDRPGRNQPKGQS